MRHLIAMLWWLFRLWGPLGGIAMAAEHTITLPPASALTVLAPESSSDGRWSVQCGGAAQGAMNVGSLWAYDQQGRDYQQFTGTTAHAAMAESAWVRADHGDWFVITGAGRRIRYAGNQDAGQLWINLHAADAPDGDFAPELLGTELTTTWAGIGRRAPLRAGGIHGVVWAQARALRAEAIHTLAATGTVAGSDFTGMVRQISSNGLDGDVRGQGWALDAGATLHAGDHWEADVTVEGLQGQLAWRRLYIADDLVVSPQVYQDPDGFLNDFGGITGAGWRDDMTLTLKPSVQADLLYHGPVTLTAGVGIEDGAAAPRVGLIIPARFGRLLLRAYPDDHALEVAATGHGWLLALRANDIPDRNPSVGSVVLSVSPITF